MKKIFTLFAAMVLAVMSYAQPANGSFASDFTLYEINKTTGDMMTDHTINLYSMLNDYKTVYIDVSATTCGPCYSFHQTGTLDGLYNNYGPNSAVNDTRVLFIEGASTGSSWAAINGSAGSSYWDCTHVYGSTTEQVPYPVIPLRLSPNYVASDASCNYYTFHSDYAIGAFPTVMMVCPNRMVYDLYGNISSNATTYHNQIASRCPTWTNTNDALLSTQKVMASMYYCENGIVPQVIMQNMGSAPLTSATLRVTYGSDVQDYEWTGNLAQFDTELVSLSPIIPTQDGSQSLTIEVINANGVADQGSLMNSHTATFGVQRTSDIATATQNFSSASALGLWTLVDNTDGYFGIYNGALRLRGYYASSGVTGECYAPLMNFSNSPTPFLRFSYAHRRYQSSSEKLQVMVSADCGETWTTVWEKSGAALATVTSGSGEFNATAAQYQTTVVDLADYAGMSNVIIKFVFTSDYGNNVFVDNIEITDVPVNVESVEESALAIFPNPVNDVLNIIYDKAISQIDVYDVNGKLVKTFTTVGNSINISDLSSGVYMLNMQTADGLVIKKIVKE